MASERLADASCAYDPDLGSHALCGSRLIAR
jgi:hypothetical protein